MKLLGPYECDISFSEIVGHHNFNGFDIFVWCLDQFNRTIDSFFLHFQDSTADEIQEKYLYSMPTDYGKFLLRESLHVYESFDTIIYSFFFAFKIQLQTNVQKSRTNISIVILYQQVIMVMVSSYYDEVFAMRDDYMNISLMLFQCFN